MPWYVCGDSLYPHRQTSFAPGPFLLSGGQDWFFLRVLSVHSQSFKTFFLVPPKPTIGPWICPRSPVSLESWDLGGVRVAGVGHSPLKGAALETRPAY